ncbi:MAG: hypothetical protein MdMp024_1899 [Bacteroidales bacterium]
MNAKEYVRQQIESFLEKMKTARVRYEYDTTANTHVIEIVPSAIYHSDKTYIAWANDMFDRFIERFPDQNICFVSDDALVGIEHAEYTLEGVDYAPFSTDKPAIVRKKVSFACCN